MRGKTMQESRVAVRLAKEFRRDLIGTENFCSVFGLGLLTHAHPDVGINNVGVFDGHRWIVGYDALAAGRFRCCLGPLDSFCIWLVSARSADIDLRPEQRSCKHQRTGNVVSITEVSELDPGDLPFQLKDSHEIRNSLARMAVVAESVDHRNGRMQGEFFDRLM